MYDFHTHLNSPQLFPHRREMMDAFVADGGTGLVNIGVNDVYNKQALEIAEQSFISYPGITVKATIGYHPCDIPNGEQHAISGLEDLYVQNKEHIVAIGECGIDLHYPDNPSLDNQYAFFEAQCDLAQKLGLPIVVHTRSAWTETMQIAQKFPDCVFYFHCWSYGPEETEKTLKLIPRCFLGYTGNITYKKADDIRQSCLLTPLDQCVLETDAPYLSPQIVRKHQNQPAFVSHIYDFVADLRHITRQELENQMKQNRHTLFAL